MGSLARRLGPVRLRRTLGAARCVRERARFAASELRDAPRVGRYTLRDSGLVAHARHPLLDMWILEEVFALGSYDPPAEALEALREAGEEMRILDLGGHVGYFGLFARGLFPGAHLTSFEPDPGNAALLRRAIDDNGLADRWTLVTACAGREPGSTEFASAGHLSMAGSPGGRRLAEVHGQIAHTFEFMQERELLTPKRLEVEVRDVFPQLLEADLVKIDIEGGEWDLLDDPRFGTLRARAITLEYHPPYGPGPASERRLEDVLGGAGYEVRFADRRADTGTLWAWRP